jgi:hypothetical protein
MKTKLFFDSIIQSISPVMNYVVSGTAVQHSNLTYSSSDRGEF